MTNIQAVSFGHRCNDSRCKGPSVGGTIGMGALGAVAGSGVYASKHAGGLKNCLELTKKDGGIVKEFCSTIAKKFFKAHQAKFLKFAGIGAAIGAGTYVAVKTISGILNRD